MTYKRTINKFNRGEVDERFLARDDVDRVVDTSSQMDNLLPIRLGPMQYRPGTQYLGATFAAERVKQVPFLAPNDGSVMLEFSQTSANPSVERMRIWDNGALVTATATADTITNGTFDTDLTGWTDADDASGVSAWATGGYMALNGNGTTNYGRRYQTLTVTAATERTLVVVVHDGEVECLLGENGADSGEIFSGVLEKGTHLLTCTPVGTSLTVTLRSKHAWVSKVDSVSYHAAGALTISGAFFPDTSTTAAVLDTLQYAQSADVIFLTTDGYRLESGAHPLLRVSRRGDKSWSLSIPQIADGPFGALNDTACTLSLSGTSGDVTVTASVPLFMDATWVGRSYRIEYGAADQYSIIVLTARASTTSASARVVYHNGTYAATADWSPGLFSYYQPGPTAVALYEGRLWLAGDGKVWASVSDAYTSFDEDLTGDSKAISRTIGFGPVQQINWLSAGPDLLAGTPSAEIRVGSNDFGDIITASNCRLIPVTSIGSDTVMPERIDDLLYIVQRSGKRVIEVSKDGFRDLMILHPELCAAGITRIGLTRHPEPRLIAVLADGTMAWALLEKAEQVTGWAPVELADADVLDVAVLPNTDEDEVYVVVKRGSMKYMERFAAFADAVGGTVSRHYDGHVYEATPGTSIAGLTHLEGKTVHVWADGAERGSYVVSGGTVTVPANSWTGAVAGLKHTALWTSNRLGQYLPASVLTDRKRVVKMGLVARDVALRNVEYGPDGSTWYPLPQTDIDYLSAPTTEMQVISTVSSSGLGDFDRIQDTLRGDGYIYVLVGGASEGSTGQVVLADPALDELRSYYFDGSTFTLQGSAFTLVMGDCSVARMTDTRVAFYDASNAELRAYNFDGSLFSLAGSGFAIAGGGVSAIAGLSNTRVAYYDANLDSLRAYDFDGANWALTGSALSIPGTLAPAMAALTDSRIALIIAGTAVLRAYDFNGSTWAAVGSALTLTGISSPGVTALTSSRIAVIRTDTDTVQAYDFDGTDWTAVGSVYALGFSAGFCEITATSSSQVVVTDSTSDYLRVLTFDGANWSAVGTPLLVTPMTSPHVASLSFSTSNPALGRLVVFRESDGTVVGEVTNAAFQGYGFLTFDSDDRNTVFAVMEPGNVVAINVATPTAPTIAGTLLAEPGLLEPTAVLAGNTSIHIASNANTSLARVRTEDLTALYIDKTLVYASFTNVPDIEPIVGGYGLVACPDTTSVVAGAMFGVSDELTDASVFTGIKAMAATNSGGLVYTVATGSAKMGVVDTYDPAALALVASLSNANFAAAADIVTSGDYVFVVTTTGKIVVVDVLDPSAPALEGVYDNPTGLGTPSQITYADGVLYVVDSTGSLVTLDARSNQQVNYGEFPLEFDGTYDTDSRIYLKLTGPATILAVTYEVDDTDNPPRSA